MVEAREVGRKDRPRPPEARPRRLCGKKIEAGEEAIQPPDAREQASEQMTPPPADVFELPGEGVGRRDGRTAEHLDQALVVGAELRPGAEEFTEGPDDLRILRLL